MQLMKLREYDYGFEEMPEPQTQTSTLMMGGAPPIPPHNRPPTFTAIATPDPEENEEGVIGHFIGGREEILQRLGYPPKTSIQRLPQQEHAPNKERKKAGLIQQIGESVTESLNSIIDGFWAANEASKRG
jgi:hypothetical protein